MTPTSPPPIEAVLFDLDGTLLDHSMLDDFLQPYLAALSARVADLVPPDQLVASLMQGSEAITANDGTRTNAEAFAETFFAQLDAPREALEARMMRFYREDFPALRTHTRRKPAARPVVQTAFDLGYEVVIATNPYFPAVAIEARLRWAGVADFPYRKVTSYENSHFAKPHLGYFREILKELGLAPAQALMVGDEAMDMVAARLGCPTFLVPSRATRPEAIDPPPTYRGTLEDVAALLRRRRGTRDAA
jgi:HAD superfamily hydrolase (TIGR01549 family)